MALVFLRVVGFVVSWPIFGVSTVPVNVKVLLSVMLSICLFSSIQISSVTGLAISEELPFMAFREIAIGLFLGFLSRCFFFAVSVAGEIISMSMGLASAQIFNPALGAQSNIIEQLQVILATLVFLAIKGHHMLLTGLAKSFEIIPLGPMALKVAGLGVAASYGQDILLMGLQIAAPVIVAILLTNMAMGIIGRAVPQINVLVTSIPVTITVGFAVMFLSLPFLVFEMGHLSNVMVEKVFDVMKAL
jgi:flagellar biosynthetic protein FliR